jgi:hypothetical protein
VLLFTAGILRINDKRALAQTAVLGIPYTHIKLHDPLLDTTRAPEAVRSNSKRSP